MLDLYNSLYNKYAQQGWWPLFSSNGYHPKDYSYPKNEDDIFEIVLGVILTQNTTFDSVLKSLNNLKNINALNYKTIKNMPIDKLKDAIKPSGYFNKKSKYILEFINFFETLNGNIPSRKELLAVKGIGEESADSILLYAYKQPEFIIDTYTKRVFLDLGLIDKNTRYMYIKILVESQLKKEIKDRVELVHIYQEFHALIVKHAKNKK